MLHNIGDRKYHCEYQVQEPNFEKDYLLSYRDGKILLLNGCIPHLCDMQSEIVPDTLQFLFTISPPAPSYDSLSKHASATILSGDSPSNCAPKAAQSDDIAFFLCDKIFSENELQKYDHIQRLRTYGSQWLAFAGVTGYHLYTWYHNNKFCGACGTKRIHKTNERALVCPACGHILYPSIAVAVIVGIIDGEKILLSKYAEGYYRNYALIAGFVEIGEALEDAVRREIYEEVGLHVKNIRYYNNQPWGFSQSILVGFFADVDGSTEISLDQNELSEAVWMERDHMPESNQNVSLTAKMMEAFRLGQII